MDISEFEYFDFIIYSAYFHEILTSCYDHENFDHNLHKSIKHEFLLIRHYSAYIV